MSCQQRQGQTSTHMLLADEEVPHTSCGHPAKLFVGRMREDGGQHAPGSQSGHCRAVGCIPGQVSNGPTSHETYALDRWEENSSATLYQFLSRFAEVFADHAHAPR